ncbi:hypothetical protein DY218_06490 [Streptomyces triticagri]|uniref:Uncharacterized protein n=1 Tax=Streptomyces triticagri TaxID=2293568 RepID=A0A372MAD1_9ACTN|nr:hypothetical protein [Streptomyces triticagri]RFU87465.1 hypothetical protein DY218_06490 [Streptomyces triticagri]
MGFWGYYVVGRSERPLAELDALSAVRDGIALHEQRAGGWQIWEAAVPDVGSMSKLAQETGAPALFGFVMDSECVAVEAAGPESGAWNACLDREAMSGYLSAEGKEPDDLFLPAADAAERAAGWSAEAGLTADPTRLTTVLTSPADPSAELLFFRFLDHLGLPAQ